MLTGMMMGLVMPRNCMLTGMSMSSVMQRNCRLTGTTMGLVTHVNWLSCVLLFKIEV